MILSRRTALVGGLSLALARPAGAAESFRVRDLWNKDMSFSGLARRLDGERVEAQGYMAPPLKAESTFFVLTNRPMSVCPFCETEAEWPDDIMAVHTRRVFDVIPYNVPCTATGTLSLGTETEAETGFVSRARIIEARVSRG
ncbi:hypothetical protein ACQ5SO_10310 [Rhodovulum sp. DZ06]|uniref:hypothetical protein n=1 Tax=Rhodovulum sp. DZ06 TaxID=3425126 RepID=UPI003D331248